MLDWLKRSFGPIEQPDPGGWRARQAIAQERVQTRAIDSFTNHPGLTEQLLAVQGLTGRPWRQPTIREALGVPAIFRAVTLISNSVGSLGVEAYRKGVRLDDDDVPRLIKRPDPFRIPRDFYRDTAFYLATRGEFWWWIAARDVDDSALSLIVVPPWEINLEVRDDRLRPRILWGNREMPARDMRHGTLLLDHASYRGFGPLQACGAAVSVAVEAQEWAANFFVEDGGYPSIVIKAAGELGETDDGENEADILRDQWMGKPNNTPRVVDDGIEDVEAFAANTAAASLLDTRNYNNGDAARMFGIPGELLEYATEGSSLTYQNIAEVFTRFVKSPLAPDYLEPIEQHMSDLLTRSTVARFNVKGFLRADAKTRWEIYNLAIPVIGAEAAMAMALEQEGMAPGDVEYAPVPFSPPQAVPPSLPVTRAAMPLRCDGTRPSGKLAGARCNRLLAEDGIYVGRCPRCGKAYASVA